MPANLYDDLAAITRLARVGQVDLYDSVKACCAATSLSSVTPLKDFVGALPDLAAKAPVKLAEIQATLEMSSGGDASHTRLAEGQADTLTPEGGSASMVGTLLNSGGIADCRVSERSRHASLGAVAAAAMPPPCLCCTTIA